MSFQEKLAILTDGYNSFATMSLSTANLFKYIGNPFFLFIATNKDDMPYLIEPRVTDEGQFEFLAYDGTPLVVDGEMKVMVYSSASPTPMDEDEQIDALWNFAMRFPPNTLIRKFVSESVIKWLERNKDIPDLYYEYLRMKTAAYKLESHVNDLEEIF